MFQKITLQHIRPYQHVDVELKNHINVLFGPNGEGKTTIIEALCVLSTTRSYRASKLFDLVSKNQTSGKIIGQTTDFETISVDILPRKHTFYKNGDRIVRTSQFIHSTRVVVLAPEHLYLISGSGDKRRQFLDHMLCQKNPIHLDVFKTYRKVIKQKQALLKQNLHFHEYKSQVEPWNQQIVFLGEEIRKQRKELLTKIQPEVELEYQQISNTKERVSLDYQQREGSIQERISELEYVEHKMKRVLVGAHRDDFGIELKEQTAEVIASQGEKASLLLALKLSEMNFLTQEQMPVLMLDDVGVTLDDERRKHLFERLDQLKPQTLMTTPNPTIVENARQIGAHILLKKKGEFQTQFQWK